MGRLLLLRHGQSTWNASGRWQGWTDTPLSEAGEAQAVRAGRVLAGMGEVPDLVACSDLARARRTAELVAGQLGYGAELMVDAGLREQDLGEWTGLTRDEIEARWPGELAARSAGALVPVPGGEAGGAFLARAVGAVRRVAARGAGLAVVVAHGGVLVSVERALGLTMPHRRYTNLSGWWLEAGPAPGDGEAEAGVALRALLPVDLLASEGPVVRAAGTQAAGAQAPVARSPGTRGASQGVTGRA
jgi:broad specificity phosphatase PhoE